MSDWFEGQLADSIAALDAGVSVNAEDRPHGAGEIGVLKTSAVSGGVFFPNQNKSVVEHERQLVSEPVQGDSILVSRMNTPTLVGESCYVRDAWPSLFLPDRLWQLKPKDHANTSMRWLSFVLQSAAYRRYVEVHATGTSGSMKNLPKSKLLVLPVKYPPAQEQHTIARILDTLDTTIRETEAIIAKLKAVKQGLLHDLLTRGLDENGELRPPQSEAPHLYKDSPLGWIPKEWRFDSIESFLDRIIDYRGKTPTKTSSGIPLITAKNVRLGYIDREPQEFISADAFDRWMTRGMPKRGDLLFTTEAPLGNIAQIDTDEQLAFAQRMIILQTNKTTVNTFLKYLILGQQFRQRLFSLGSGSTVEGIQQSTFRRMVIAVPESIEEQYEIAQQLISMELRLDKELMFLQKGNKTKSGLMDDLLTGRVRVTPLLEAAETTVDQAP